MNCTYYLDHNKIRDIVNGCAKKHDRECLIKTADLINYPSEKDEVKKQCGEYAYFFLQIPYIIPHEEYT